MPIYAITMLAAGIGIPVLAAMNAALGRSLGAPMLAGVVLIAVGLLTASLVAITQGPSALVKLTTAPKHLLNYLLLSLACKDAKLRELTRDWRLSHRSIVS